METTAKPHVNEQCWTLVGSRQGAFWQCALTAPTEGRPTEVEFEVDSVIRRDETRGDILGFLHTHPCGRLYTSRKDVETMQAWTSCLGRPLLCLVACGTRVEAFLFLDDECKGRRLSAAEYLNEDTVIVCDRRLGGLRDTNDR